MFKRKRGDLGSRYQSSSQTFSIRPSVTLPRVINSNKAETVLFIFDSEGQAVEVKVKVKSMFHRLVEQEGNRTHDAHRTWPGKPEIYRNLHRTPAKPGKFSPVPS